MPVQLARISIAVVASLVFAAPTSTAEDGIWVDRGVLRRLPTSGPAWMQLWSEANRNCPSPNLRDQDTDANTCIMAKALVAERMESPWLVRDVVASLTRVADAPPYKGRALALGRELVAYVIAADIVRLSQVAPDVDARFRARLRDFLTTPTRDGPDSLVACHEQRANNWGTHCGATRIAIAAYLGDAEELARAAAVFKGFLGDRDAYAGFSFGDLSWQCDPDRPVPINPKGCARGSRSIDGVLTDDQRRGGEFRWPAPKENYVYEALQGALAQAVLLHRAGFDAFEWGDKALHRAFTWLYEEAGYPASGDDAWQVAVINYFYGTSFAASGPLRPGKNVGWTEWTHAR